MWRQGQGAGDEVLRGGGVDAVGGLTPAGLGESLTGMTLAAPIVFHAIPMATLYEVEHSYLRVWLAAAAGALIVLVTSKVLRNKSLVASQIGVDRVLLWAASIAFVVSWFLPVIKNGLTFPEGLPGWQAMRAVLDPLWDHDKLRDRPWFSALSIASGLTNVVMIAALSHLHLTRLSPANRWKHWVVLAAAINASWTGFDWRDDDLRIGYYLWVVSFLLLAIAVLARGARTNQRGAPEVGKGSPSSGENSSALASP